MAKGIVVKIWNIKEGSMGRGAGVQIKDSIGYITDEDKCDVHLSSQNQVGRELTYIANDVKTLKGVYIGTKNISDVKTAPQEMMQVKLFFGKTGGRVALHGIISLDEEESDKKNAGKLMMLASDMLDEIFPDHQAVYAVHTNTENLHVHFVVNTVGLLGKKIHMDKSFMKECMEPCINRLSEKYGFSPNAEWKKEKKADLTPYAQRVIELRSAIDEAIERSDTYEQFLRDLKSQGIAAQSGKHLSLKKEGMTRAIRSHRLGSRYTVDAIKNRILTKKEEMIKGIVSDVADKTVIPAGVYFRTDPLKKYRDMTKEEKRSAVEKLRAGKNPWKERRRQNWQMERMADEFAKTSQIYELIKTFSKEDPSAASAMANIINLQRKLSEEKKEIKRRLKDYEPIIKLYEQARIYEAKAYLYEMEDQEDFKEDYEAYKRICTRLRDGYNKSMEEVAEYLDDQKLQILYAEAQQKELSCAYKTIKRFSEGDQKEKDSYMGLFEAVGFSKARSYATLYSVFESSIKYIAADGTGCFIRAVIIPEEAGGQKTERADITVFDEKGNEKETFSSRDLSIKEFNQKLFELKGELGLYQCKCFDTKQKAQDFARSQEKHKERMKANEL